MILYCALQLVAEQEPHLVTHRLSVHLQDDASVRSADTEEPAMTPPEPPVSPHTLVSTPWSNMQTILD